MTLGELQEQVNDMVRMSGQLLDLEVFAVSDYGDHCHTQQLVPLGFSLEIVTPYKTAYSASGLAVKDEEDFDEDVTRDGEEEVIVFK